jgi:hypothetical protein
VSSRTARDIQRNPVSPPKKTNQNKTKQQTNKQLKKKAWRLKLRHRTLGTEMGGKVYAQ